MSVEGLSQESRGNPIHHSFLYADYSPFDENMNVIETLKDFVSITGRIIRIHSDNEMMAAALSSADTLRQDVILALKQVSTNTANAIDWFHKKYPDALTTNLHTSSAALLNDAKKNISDLLMNTESGLEEQCKKYKDNIISRISDNHATVAALLQSWLSRDYKSFPTSLFSDLLVEMTVNIDTANLKAYVYNRKACSQEPRSE
jgi:hypothetical protein